MVSLLWQGWALSYSEEITGTLMLVILFHLLIHDFVKYYIQEFNNDL